MAIWCRRLCVECAMHSCPRSGSRPKLPGQYLPGQYPLVNIPQGNIPLGHRRRNWGGGGTGPPTLRLGGTHRSGPNIAQGHPISWGPPQLQTPSAAIALGQYSLRNISLQTISPRQFPPVQISPLGHYPLI